VPSLPFGGHGDSGFGRIHGADGLREFTRAKAITRQRFDLPVPLLSFDRTEKVDKLLGRTVRLPARPRLIRRPWAHTGGRERAGPAG
jgi:aldehyde dehydrogenase (NAD+)